MENHIYLKNHGFILYMRDRTILNLVMVALDFVAYKYYTNTIIYRTLGFHTNHQKDFWSVDLKHKWSETIHNSTVLLP